MLNRIRGPRVAAAFAFVFALAAHARPSAHAPFALAIDGVTATQSTLNQSSHTITHTITSNTDGLLTVAVCYGNGNTRDVTGITWNTTENLVFVGKINNTTNNKAVEWWRTPAGTPPATGTHNAVITMSSAVGAIQKIGGAVISLTGVDQTTPIDVAFASNTGNSATPGGSITTSTANALAFEASCGTGDNTNGTSAEDERWDLNPGADESFFYGSSITTTSATTYTFAETWDASFNWAMGMIAIRPASAAPSSCPVCAKVNAPISGGGFLSWLFGLRP